MFYCCQAVLTPTAGELLSKVPTRSIVSQEAIVNGLLTQLAQLQGIQERDFMNNHPGGAIGAAVSSRSAPM